MDRIKIETIVKVITYLVGIIGLIAIFRHVSLPFIAIVLFMFSLSILFEYHRRFYIPRWALNGLSIMVIIVSLYRLDNRGFMVQMLEALLLLLGIKFLEDKRFRDYMQIYGITLFLMAGLSLLSLDITFLLYLFSITVLLSINLVLLTYYAHDPAMELERKTMFKVMTKSIYIPLFAIPLAGLLFVILPRTQYPLLNFLNREEMAKTGFTDNVRLGVISRIQEDAGVCFRVKMERIQEDALYWRGITLDHFDGTSWKATDMRPAPSGDGPGLNGRFIYQTFYLEPYDGRQLFAIDRPLHISLRGAVSHGDYTYALRTNIDKRIRYEAISVLADSIRENIDIAFYLQLPASISNRVKDLVANLTQKRAEEEKVLAILKYLNNGSFRYTLEELPVSDDPIDTFLFHARQGNCEYFASSFAIMLRMAGIPSRLVGGYRGGYYNDVGRYYLVLQRNAHLWVEAYLASKGWKGWVRFDPTPQTIGGPASLYGGSLSIRLRLLLDTINYYWYTTVINYDFERQLSLVHRLSNTIRRPTLEWWFIKDIINGMAESKYLVFAIIFICVAMSITYIMIHKVRPVEKRIIVRFYKVMRMCGYQKRETEGLEEFVLRIKEAEVREASYTFVKEFERLYFKDKMFTPLDKRRLKRMIKAIKTCSHGSA